jgi:maltose alpha-D-glucosyltransferase/alpha-amylase
MQWSTYDNGGFSTAPVEKHVRPVLAGGDYGFEQVAVSRQRGDRDSLFNWLAMLIRVRRECPEIGTGQWSVIDAGDDAVLGLRHDGDSSSTVILNNLAATHRTVTLELPADEAERATDLLGDRNYAPLADDLRMRINGHGYRWLRLGGIY